MSPEKGSFQKEISSSNHYFSGDILVFRGVEIKTKMFANTQLEFQKDLKPNANDLLLQMQLAMHCRQWHLEGRFFP